MKLETRSIAAGDLCFETDCLGDGPRLALLLHGFPETKYSWRHQIEPLAEQGYTVWAPNLRGYGQTSRPHRCSDYALPKLIGDVAALTAVAQQEGLTPALLIGHDWGGAIAWASMLSRAVAFERLVVMNIPHPLILRRRIWAPRQLMRSWYMLLFQLPWLGEWWLGRNDAQAVRHAFVGMAVHKRRFPQEVLDHYASHAREPGALTAMIRYYRASRTSFFTTPMQADTGVPTLMIWGEQDHALGIELTHGTGDLVADFTFHLIPEASHWVQQDAPESVNAALAAWLQGEPLTTP